MCSGGSIVLQRRAGAVKRVSKQVLVAFFAAVVFNGLSAQADNAVELNPAILVMGRYDLEQRCKGRLAPHWVFFNYGKSLFDLPSPAQLSRAFADCETLINTFVKRAFVVYESDMAIGLCVWTCKAALQTVHAFCASGSLTKMSHHTVLYTL